MCPGDVEPQRISPDPGQPTQTDIDEQMFDHYPFRSWCEYCVMGKATGEQHSTGAGSKEMAKDERTETGRIGPGRGDDKELKRLNRIVRWCPEGLKY